MYYRENDQVVENNNIENYTLMDGGINDAGFFPVKAIGLFILYILLGVIILAPIIFKQTSNWIFESNEKKGFYISLVLLIIILIIVLNCSCF